MRELARKIELLAAGNAAVPPFRERGQTEIADLAVRLLCDLRRDLGCGLTHLPGAGMSCGCLR